MVNGGGFQLIRDQLLFKIYQRCIKCGDITWDYTVVYDKDYCEEVDMLFCHTCRLRTLHIEANDPHGTILILKELNNSQPGENA